MELKVVTVGPIDTNCYILLSKDAVVIDPGDEAELIYEQLDGKKLKGIIYTHGHWDHTGAAAKLKERTGAKVFMSKDDIETLDMMTSLRTLYNSDGQHALPDAYLEDDQILNISDMNFKVLATPGHSVGSLCLYTKSMLFCGDTIFKESVGRTDLPGGNMNSLLKSIRNKIYVLDDNVILHPGHGPSSTVGWEKQHNLYCHPE